MFDELLADIDSLQGDSDTKSRIINLMVTRYKGVRISISALAARRQNRDKLMAQLRRAGYTPKDQIRVLSSRLGVSRETARLWVRADAQV